jgi:transcriptional regulatory protein RtcR
MRMATLAEGSRITVENVDDEIIRLKKLWSIVDDDPDVLVNLLGAEALAQIDAFDRIQLSGVIEFCQQSKSLADAGRQLFSASRTQKATSNDSDRLRKYLARFGLSWESIRS